MKQLIILTAFILTSSFSTAATQFNFKPEAGKMMFKTKGWPNLVTIKGQANGVTGQLNEDAGKISGQLDFNLASLKTGIDLRDEHMKNKYLEVKKFPTAKLKVTDLKTPEGLSGSFKFKAMMTLHGVTQEVSGKADLENGSDSLKINAEIPIKLSDFKIAIPSYKGITVAEKVTVTFESKVAKVAAKAAKLSKN